MRGSDSGVVYDGSLNRGSSSSPRQSLRTIWEKGILMEYVNCNLCGSDNAQVLLSKKDKFGIAEDEFNVVECQG